MCRSTKRSVQPGHVRSTALPPNRCPWETVRGKWAMIWSAMITETAIVISAWRSSWPWFQRRNACCMKNPTTAMQGAATRSGTSHSQVFTSLRREREALAGHRLLDLVGDVAAEEVERAVGHVHDPHQPEDQGEAARDDEEGRRERDRVEDDLQERRRVVDRRPELRRAPAPRAELDRFRDEEHVEEREEHEPTRAAPAGPASSGTSRAAHETGSWRPARSSCADRNRRLSGFQSLVSGEW